MANKTILFVDDVPSDLPSVAEQGYVWSKFGLRSLLVSADDPIESAVKCLQNDTSIVGVVTDRCNRSDFSHVKEFLSIRPSVLVAVHCGRLTSDDKKAAARVGASGCYQKGDSYADFLVSANNDYLAAERRFRDDLPLLLRDSSMLGKWVAYTRDGRCGVSDNDLTLIEKCEKSLSSDQFVVASVTPDDDEISISDAWFPITR